MAERTPRGARLPQNTLAEVVPIAEAIDALGAPSTQERIAQQLGVSPSGGGYRGKVAAASHYGLTQRDGDRLALSDRARAILGDDEGAAVQARREAVAATGFGPIMRAFKGRSPNAGAIQARLEDDYGASSAASAIIAGTLVTTATAEGLIANDRFDAEAIEGVEHVLAADTPTPASRRRPGATAARNGDAGGEPEREQPTTRRRAQTPEPRRKGAKEATQTTVPFARGVQVVLKVDASSWTPQQVAELIKALRGEDATGSQESTQTQ